MDSKLIPAKDLDQQQMCSLQATANQVYTHASISFWMMNHGASLYYHLTKVDEGIAAIAAMMGYELVKKDTDTQDADFCTYCKDGTDENVQHCPVCG